MGLVSLLGVASCTPPPPTPGLQSARWTVHASGTTASLRGLSVASPEVAWASGSRGTWLRTIDGARTWQTGTVPGADSLDFRDVEAVSADTAYLLSAGEGDRSRIFKTVDGGRSWTLQFTNPHAAGFFDGMAFWDSENGIAFSDPVDGRFLVITTTDGGRSWTRVPPERLPPAIPGEAAFAASGTGIAVQPPGHVWFATGGGRAARVFHSADRGRTWTVAETPLPANPSSGIFGLAFQDARTGVAVGGDYLQPAQAGDNVLVTVDGGRTWARPAGQPPAGYRSGVAYVPGSPGPTLVAVGTSGSDLSRDGGRSWTRMDTLPLNTVAWKGGGWAVGPQGRVARTRLPAR